VIFRTLKNSRRIARDNNACEIWLSGANMTKTTIYQRLSRRCISRDKRLVIILSSKQGCTEVVGGKTFASDDCV